MIRDKFRNLSAISHGAFELKKSGQPKPVVYFIKSSIIDWVLNAPLMTTVARY